MTALTTATYAGTVLGLVTGPLLARALGPGGRGEVASAIVYAQVAAALLGLGMPTAVAFAVGKRRDAAGAVLASVVRFFWLILPVALLLGALCVWAPLRKLSEAGRIGAFILVAGASLTVVGYCLDSILYGEGALGSLAVLRILPPGLAALAILPLALFHWLTVGSYLVTVAITSGPVYVLTGLRLARVKRSASPLPLLPLLSFGLRALVGGLASFASLRLDQALIAPMLGVTELGYYAVAVSIAAVPLGLGHAINARLFPGVASAVGENVQLLVGRFIRLSLTAALIVVVPLVILAPPLVAPVFGQAFLPASSPLLILLPGTVALAGSASANACLIALGRPELGTVAEVFGAALTAVGLIVFVPSFGIVGAAAVSTIAYGATFGLFLGFLRKLGARSLTPGIADARLLFRGAKEEAGRVKGWIRR